MLGLCAILERDGMTSRMTSSRPTTALPAPQVFTLSTLPSYEDAVKSSGEPPSYEQALTDLRVDTLEDVYRNSLPRSRNVPERRSLCPNDFRGKLYRWFCCILAAFFSLLLGLFIFYVVKT